MRISVDGDQLRVGPVDAQEADLAVRSSLAGVLAQLPLLANARRGDSNGKGRVRVAGDAELARRLQQLAKGFDPDWQQPFVSVFGEVLGVQVANTLRNGLQHARRARSIWPTAPPSSSPRNRAMWCRVPSWMPSTMTWTCCATTSSVWVHACSACGCRMKAVLRASRIGRVILRYRLDDLLQGTPAERWLRLAKPFVPRASADIAAQSRGARLRPALQDLGPIFVKFGQILSTRRDLVPPDVANELTLLQDRVKPFDGETARRIVEDALGLPVSAAFASFDTEPLASASIAQVHAATLADGRRWWSRYFARASRSRSTPTSPCSIRWPRWSSAPIHAPTRSVRAKWWPRSRTPCPPSWTCSAKAPMPACCAASGKTATTCMCRK